MLELARDEGVRPFSSGSEYGDWEYRNCRQCTRSASCDLPEWLARAYVGYGTVPDAVARRLGRHPEGERQYCTEIVRTPQAQAEYDRRMSEPVWSIVRVSDGKTVAGPAHGSVTLMRDIIRRWNENYPCKLVRHIGGDDAPR